MPDSVTNGNSGPDYETWFNQQPDDVKGLIEGHTTGLKSALDKERSERKEFEKQLRIAASEQEKGSEARKLLEGQADRMALLERQAAFFDAAHTAGATNLKLAWLAAVDAGLVDDKGQVDMDKVKAAFPQLFGAKTVAGNAGAGTGDDPPKGGMNAYIRKSAGR
jgi:hypothetical protein